MQNASKPNLGWFRRQVARGAARALKYAGIPLRDPALIELFGPGRASLAGVNVDEHTADSFSAYFSGVQLISNTIAMLPLECCKKTSKGLVVDEEHRITVLFRDGPNPILSPFDLTQMMQSHSITWGNGYAQIKRAGKNGPVEALWQLMPSQMESNWEDDGRKTHKFQAMHPGEKTQIYEDMDILQLPGAGYDGLAGVSVVHYAEESLGLGLAAERYGASHFGNNAVPGGVIQHPMDLTDTAEERVAEEFEKKLKGPSRTRRIVVLDEGMKYIPIGIPPEDSQFLQTREFQVQEIARWLRIPPHMLYYMLSATNSNVEQQSLEFLVYTLGPWLSKWCNEVRRKLLTQAEWKTHVIRFNLEPLLKMDAKSRFEIYNTGRNLGVYTLNDILAREGLPLMDDVLGNQHIVPSTMKVLGNADPTTPIAPEVIKTTLDVLRSIKELPMQSAIAIINATMPSASEAFVKEFTNALVLDRTISTIRMPKE